MTGVGAICDAFSDNVSAAGIIYLTLSAAVENEKIARSEYDHLRSTMDLIEVGVVVGVLMMSALPNLALAVSFFCFFFVV